MVTMLMITGVFCLNPFFIRVSVKPQALRFLPLFQVLGVFRRLYQMGYMALGGCLSRWTGQSCAEEVDFGATANHLRFARMQLQSELVKHAFNIFHRLFGLGLG